MCKKKYFLITLSLVVVASVAAPRAFGHTGRRLEILVIDNQLFVQGYLSPGVMDDGGGSPRPYYNSLHDHWDNVAPGVALADLPGYDLFTPGPLLGFDLSLELLGASQWVSPPLMPAPGTIPSLVPLGVGDTISIERGGTIVDTDTLGTLPLVATIDAVNGEDLDIDYQIDLNPSDVIYVLEWQMSTTAPGIAPSGSTYTLLSPDGADAAEKLHHASLYLESYLGVPVPEPASVVLFGLGTAALLACGWRRHRIRRSA